ncbi:Radical SAM domain protein [Candidatus Desulfarcum epimagneticum]|uniref:Radical SAM domain protein n=1 Tax=uncultured Desulfobacteraceae bacterium TaxID=218296 RepID=A0A484HG89_9BACT|nr:Radical SAM domain protein [uncultured Desulfobacteraceae bacterium]
MKHPHHPPKSGHGEKKDPFASPRLIAWEVTRSCNLACVHCRAAADKGPYEGELSPDASLALVDQMAEVGSPIVILTGGEPLLRPDIFDIAAYGTEKGLRMVMAPNGSLITKETAKKMADSGIKRISVSLDGNEKNSHDRFRGVDGAFDSAVRGIRLAKDAGVEFQINTTITQANLELMPAIHDLAIEMGAAAHHIFLLVPTGRGKYISDQAISAEEYEKTLNWFYDRRGKTAMHLKATCAPHYYRILRQRAKEDGETVSFETHGMDAVTRGCLAGTGFCFISHRGIVRPCGFLHADCGDVTRWPFQDIWKASDVFLKLRDFSALKGKCGACEYKKVCGGCRARAYEATGDFMTPEPLCAYQPLGG